MLLFGKIAMLDVLSSLRGRAWMLHLIWFGLFGWVSLPLALLASMRRWLDAQEIHNPKTAHLLCKVIPAQCPFERDITVLGHHLVHIPPMCKLNPFYEQLVGLRFRALCYLDNDCGEDISSYV
jgi:hypothetical protein